MEKPAEMNLTTKQTHTVILTNVTDQVVERFASSGLIFWNIL